MCKETLENWGTDMWQSAEPGGGPPADPAGGPPVCATKLGPKPKLATRKVIHARYLDGKQEGHVVLVYDDQHFAGHCCFDPGQFNDDHAFADWAKRTLSADKVYKGEYTRGSGMPAVECPPPLAHGKLPPLIEIKKAAAA